MGLSEPAPLPRLGEAGLLISWRYHIVSIVAVILALSLGVLAGATVVGDRFVEQLQGNTDRAEQTAARYREEADRLRGYTSETIAYLTDGKLVGSQIVLVTQDGSDDRVLSQTIQSVELAGGEVVAQLTVSAAIVDPARQEELDAIVGPAGTDPQGLPGALAARLADRLSAGAAAREEDLLTLLEGFVRVEAAVDPTAIGGPDTLVVVLASGSDEPSLAPDRFLLPLVRELAATSTPTAAGDGLSSTYGFVADVRADDIPDGAIVTVDDLDQIYGGVALVLGLANLQASPSGGGDYGVDGSGFLPAVASTPGP